MKSALWIDSSFHGQIFCSMQCYLTDNLPTVELLSKLELILSNSVLLFANQVYRYSKCFFKIYHFNKNLYTIFRTDLSQETTLSLLIHKLLLICLSWTMRLHQFPHISGSTLSFQFSWYFHHICSDFLHWSLELLKATCEGWNQLLPHLLMLILWPLYESGVLQSI